jgi:hypothetical protein
MGHGVAFLPGVSRNSLPAAPRGLDLVTWELPEGLLVADRTGPAGAVRFGAAFAPAHARSEWFLVRASRSGGHPAPTADALAEFGRVHFMGTTAAVVEVPADRLEAFYARGFAIRHIALTPVPPDRRSTPSARAFVTAAAATDTALKRAFVDSLSQPKFNQLIQEISGYTVFWFNGQLRSIPSRYYNTAGKNLAGDYLKSKLEAWGYAAAFDTFLVGGVTCRNIVGTKTGVSAPDEIFVVGGHYDCMPATSSNCHGAEDNGSGTSLVMELARISRHRQFDRTVQFALFDSEEQGMNGSEHFVADAVAAGRDIVGAIAVDMVTWYQGNFGLHIEGETAWEPLMSAMQANVTRYTPCVYVKDYYSWGSDHVSFQDAGIPAFLAIDYDYEDYPYYHTANDTWPHIQVTAPLGIQIARAAAATLADEAGLRPDLTAVPPDAISAPSLTARPNPFNPLVTVTFALARPASAEVAVYDLAGRQVAMLRRGALPSGPQRVIWNGRDDHGRAAPSGAYVCRLRIPSGSSSVKLVLTR